MSLFSELCFLSGDSDGGDSYCEESAEEAQIIGVVFCFFSLLYFFMSGCCPGCMNYRNLVPYGVSVHLPVLVFPFIAMSSFTTLTEEQCIDDPR